jgi:iron(III) transport system permease protein
LQTVYRILLLTIIIIPIGALLLNIGWDFGEYSSFIFSQLTNTIFLVTLTTFFALTIGGISAWFTALYNYPLKKIIESLYILMMLYPSYVMAIMLSELSTSLMGFWGLVLTLTIVTIPYVFLILTMSLRSQSQQLVETALMFGKDKRWVKLKLLLPLLKPAIIIAAIFVISDTMSEFGATYFMGVDTFMTGIYELWLGLYEVEMGLQLSALIFITIAGGVWLSGVFGKKALPNPPKTQQIKPEKLNGWKAWTVTFLTSIPVVVGFVIPSLILIDWNISAWGNTDWLEVGWVAFQSFGVATIVAVATLLLATEFLYHFKKDQRKARLVYSIISSMYALPGIVVAVTMLWLVGFVDTQFLWFFYLYALIVKYIALSMDSVYAGLQKVDRQYYYSAKGLGKTSNWYKWWVQLPIAQKSYIVGGILVWIDVMRELVIGYIVRPQWIDLLSVKIFSFIDLELLYMAGPWILAMVVITLIPIWWVNRIVKMER